MLNLKWKERKKGYSLRYQIDDKIEIDVINEVIDDSYSTEVFISIFAA